MHEFIAEVDGIRVPVTGASEAAFSICAEYADAWLRDHSLRSYFWAAAYGAEVGIPYDAELLYVAALLHDLALTSPFDSHLLPFEEAAGHVARVFSAGAGWPEERRDRLARVIVLHMRDDVSPADDAESHLLQVAVSVDVSGSGLGAFAPAFTATLLDALPRSGFAAEFLHVAREQAHRKPYSAAAKLMHAGWADRILTNPLDRS